MSTAASVETYVRRLRRVEAQPRAQAPRRLPPLPFQGGMQPVRDRQQGQERAHPGALAGLGASIAAEVGVDGCGMYWTGEGGVGSAANALWAAARSALKRSNSSAWIFMRSPHVRWSAGLASAAASCSALTVSTLFKVVKVFKVFAMSKVFIVAFRFIQRRQRRR